jgi:purine-nucleoside phosphorylase
MHPEESPVSRIVERLTERFGEAPPLALVLGSGLGQVVDQIGSQREAVATALGLPSSTVPGHAGRVVRGRLGGVEMVALAGRVHLYEGYPPAVLVRGVRALQRWGVRTVVFTCSAGGLRHSFPAGSLAMITDHINMQSGNPLVGERWGKHRFPDLTAVYDVRLRAVLRQAAIDEDVTLNEGVYVAMTGPGYETPAEVRFLQTIGADLVGMSTVPEVLAAAELGLPVCAIAVVANPAAGLHDRPLTHEEVTDAAGGASVALGRVLAAAAPGLVAAVSGD